MLTGPGARPQDVVVRCLAHGAITCYGDAAHLARLYGRLGPWCRTRQLGESDGSGRFDRARGATDPERPHVGLVTYDAKDPATSFPPIESLRPPAGAPTCWWCCWTTSGFGASSAFGGPISTPTAERLAAQGLKYTRFHTTALCAPTRGLAHGPQPPRRRDGRDHRAATSAPGYNSLRPNTCAPLAEVLKLNGYSTAQFGKCHEVPVWRPARWALRRLADRERVRALLRVHRR